RSRDLLGDRPDVPRIHGGHEAVALERDRPAGPVGDEARVLRVGHRGAAALAPQNTIESVRAALAVGVDMIEFDVSPGLVVAHDRGHPGPQLDDFLAELADLLPADVGLMVDLKAIGYELAAL